MKKILCVLVSLITIQVSAQQEPVLKNKRGILILPQRGDYCMGISANPFFYYLGNIFNGNLSNGSPSFQFANSNQAFFFKYMKSNKMAYRGSFRIGINNNSMTYDVKDVSPGAPVNAIVTDVLKIRSNNIGLGFGIEKRKGSTRLQGFYGAEAVLQLNSSKNLYEYGNKLENMDTGLIRVKKFNSSGLFSIGCRAFAGVEYFIAPNFSIGGELGYGPSFRFGTASEQTVEMYDFTTNSVVEEKIQKSAATRGFSLDTDNYNGIIKILFYF